MAWGHGNETKYYHTPKEVMEIMKNNPTSGVTYLDEFTKHFFSKFFLLGFSIPPRVWVSKMDSGESFGFLGAPLQKHQSQQRSRVPRAQRFSRPLGYGLQ